jgi:CrcB protein
VGRETLLVAVVALGGALGSVARYGLSRLLNPALSLSSEVPAWPWGTCAANLLGSFLIGVLFGWSQQRGMSPLLSAALLTGVLGGFTTFSSFSLETVALLHKGAVTQALLYTLGSVVLGVAAAGLGVWLALVVVSKPAG